MTRQQLRWVERHDGGAVLVWVALTLVMVLIPVTALVIDVGALFVAKRELQNGADASALAIAQSCANGDCGDAWSLAGQYTEANAAGAVPVTVCGAGSPGGLAGCTDPAPAHASGATGWVRVTTSENVTFRFVPGSQTVTASGAAGWGAMASGPVFPLVLSECEYLAFGGSVGGTVPTGAHYLYFHGVGGSKEPGVTRCTASTSGQDLPGGFGWLVSGGACESAVTGGEWAGASPGASPSKACKDELDAQLGQPIVVAIFDGERGTGTNGEYLIAGFAAFVLQKYSFPGAEYPSKFKCPKPPGTPGGGGDISCIYGEFTPLVSDGGEWGGADFGVRVVKMVG